MTDIVDKANDTADLFMAAELQNRQAVAKVASRGIGMCLNCGVDLEGDRRWCDAGCRDDWERR